MVTQCNLISEIRMLESFNNVYCGTAATAAPQPPPPPPPPPPTTIIIISSDSKTH
jgi:hypothetical protein